MALDPFFQQGMNAWSAETQARSAQARKLDQLAQTGQIKDLLQRTGHRQKMSEGEQTGQFNIANTLAGMGILSTRGAKEAGGQPTAVTNDLTNVMNAERFGRNLSRIGAGAGPLAGEVGQYLDDPVGAVEGRGSTFTAGTPGSIIRATKMAPIQAAAEDTEKRSFMDTPGGKRIWGIMGQSTKKRSAKGKGGDVKVADNVLATLDRLKGTKDEVKKTVRDPKTGKTGSIYKVGKQYLFKATDGTVRDVTGEL